jgi:homocysteine S-methyltransferase
MKTITLLDGGLGQEIQKRAGQPAHPLWSAKVMMEQPGIVRSVHRDFIEAGARVITTNNYTLTPSRLQRDGQLEWLQPLHRQALSIARSAASEQEGVQVAGCLPPLIGSYTTDQRSYDSIKQEYDQLVDLQAGEVDLFIAETLSSIREGVAAVRAAKASGKPILLSFSLSDEYPITLRSGELVSAALEAAEAEQPDGLLFNCSFPESIGEGIAQLKGKTYLSYGGYANGFTSVAALKPGGTVDALEARADLNEHAYAKHALHWVAEGAAIVGGCCEVGPGHIARLRDALQAEGYRLGGLQSGELAANDADW